MNHPMSHFMYICLNVAIFTSAVYILLTALFLINEREKVLLNDMGEKASITMQNAETKDNKAYVSLNSASVYNNILSVTETYSEEAFTSGEIVITVQGVTLTADDMQKIKEKKPTVIKNLRALIDAHEEYRSIYEYDDNLILRKITFEGV